MSDTELFNYCMIY